MLDKNRLAQLEAGYQMTRQQAQPSQAQSATKQTKNTTKFGGRNGVGTSLISEGAGLAGGVIGGALGSIVPVAGTAIGAAAGAGIGSFLGRLGENKIRDNRLGIGDAAKEGGLSAVLSAPLKGIKYAATAGSAVKNGGNLAEALTAGAKAADTSTIKNATSAIKNRVGSALTGSSDALATKSLKLNGSKFNTDFANRTGEEVGQFANRFGIVGKDANTIKDTVIKPGQDLYAAGITAIGNIPKSEVQAAVKSSISKLATSPLPENKALAAAVSKQADELIAQYGDNIPASALADLKNAVYGQVDKSITDKAGKNANNTYDLLGNSFRKAINTAADKAGVGVDTNALKQAGLNYKSTSLGDLGNELFALDNLTKQVDVKSRIGQGSSPLGLLTSVGGTTGGVIGGLPGAVAGATAAKVANNSGVERAVANQLGKAGERLSASAVTPQLANTPLQAGLSGLKRGVQGVAGGSLLNALQGSGVQSGMQDSTIPSTDSVANMANASNIDPLSQDANASVNQQSTNPYNPANAQAAIQSILQQGGTMNDVKDYLSIVESIAALNPTGTALSATTGASLATSSNGINTLDQLEGLFNQTGGGSGKIVGGINNFLGGKGLNDQTATYNALANSSVSQLAKAINGGGQVSDADAAVIISALPKVTDNPQVAQAKFAALKQRLEAARQNTLMYGSGATDTSSLTSALTQ